MGSSLLFYSDLQYPHAVGKSTVLVAALQGFNNARVVFSGSLDMFSDEFLSSPAQQGRSGAQRFDHAANADFVDSISQWVFKERGVLRYSDVRHYPAGRSNETPGYYTVSDEVVGLRLDMIC